MTVEAAIGSMPGTTRMANPVLTSPIDTHLQAVFDIARALVAGDVATYIPELAGADPDLLAMCIVTVDGTVYELGDAHHPFTIQSVSKPFVYGLALEDHGIEVTLRHVGVEPTGDAFNSIVVDEGSQRPFNPMVNAGAIVTSGLIEGRTPEARLERIVDLFTRYTGRRPELDEQVYRSELATGDRNRAIGYLMRNLGMLDDPEGALDLYFRQCSLLVDCRDLASFGATLANGGVNPSTGMRAVEERYVGNVLSVMSMCGMYDYAGEWIYRVGLPAKSGVSGGVVAVLPGQLGIGVYSPPLDARGNSARGVRICEELSRRFGLHLFESHLAAPAVVRRIYRGDVVPSKRYRRPSQRAVLDRLGVDICVFELQGDVCFASLEVLTRAVLDEGRDAAWVVFDRKHLGHADSAGSDLFAQLVEELRDAGRTPLVTHLAPGSPVRELLEARGVPARCFVPDADAALEHCEDALLQREAALDPPAPANLEDHDLFRGFSPAEVVTLLDVAQREEFRVGDVVFREGDPTDRMFFLLEGTVSVWIGRSSGAGSKRLAVLGPGAAFGEVALLDGGVRSSDIRADEAVIAWSLSRDAVQDLLRAHPHLAALLYQNLASGLSGRLRHANEEIRALEQ